MNMISERPGCMYSYSPFIFLFRGAENRTRISRSQSEYTTTVLRPVDKIPVVDRVGVPRIALGSHAPEACILLLYYTPALSTT